MHCCPYCREPFEFKDLLFFISRNTYNANENPDVDLASSTRPTDTDTFANSMNNPMDFSDAPQEETENAAEAAEDRDHIGQWAEDTVYMSTRGKFWKAETITEDRFVVRWDPQTASPGTARATLMHTSGLYPTAVELCEEDQEKAGWTGSISQAMCPHCHFELPTNYLWVPDENCHSIALIGYPSSGKTQYKVSLVEELGKLRGVYNLVRRAEVLKDSKDFAKLEGGNDGVIESTHANAVVLPMIFAIERDDKVFLITLYDLPGEVYTEQQEFEGHLIDHKGLRGADGAILMIDPVQLYSELEGRTVLMIGSPRQDPEPEGVAEMDNKEKTIKIKYVDPETDILAPLDKMKRFGIGENLKCLSIVLAKVDVLMAGNCCKYFQGPFLRQLKMCHSREYDDWHSPENPGVHEGHFGRVKKAIINQVDMEVMRVIDLNPIYNYRNIKQEICDEFSGNSLEAKNIRAFTISTLRRIAPDTPEDVRFMITPQTRLPRHRILEPLLYLMARWGVVQSDSDDWGEGAQNPFPVEKPNPDGEGPKKKKGLLDWFKR